MMSKSNMGVALKATVRREEMSDDQACDISQNSPPVCHISPGIIKEME